MRTQKYPFLIVMLFSFFGSTAQQIETSTIMTPEALVNNVLVSGCVETSNVVSSVNGTDTGVTSYGRFERGASSFPFESGIVIGTGNVASVGTNTPIAAILGDGTAAWGTDSDLETILGNSNTLNATSIEFDFVSITNTLSFNYIFASEEYEGVYPCNIDSDSFVFLIKETGSLDDYTNIAVVPGTTLPVNIANIRPEINGFCTAENEQYFDGYQLGDTNFNGRTRVLTAATTIVPYQSYHIKLIIADQTDQFYDSAVFIEGNSFNTPIDLGPDINTCATEVALSADIDNPLAVYSWFQDGNLIVPANTSSYTATVSGTYTIRAEVPIESENCIIEDTIEVVLASEQTVGPIANYQLCDVVNPGDLIEEFDLTVKNNEIRNTLPSATYVISYHVSEADAQSNINPITTPIENTSNPQAIYFRVEDVNSGCLSYNSFQIEVTSELNLTAPTNMEYCSDLPGTTTTRIYFDDKTLEIQNGNTNLSVSYHHSEADAMLGRFRINSGYLQTDALKTYYVRIQDVNSSCESFAQFDSTINSTPNIVEDDYELDACDTDMDGIAVFDLTSFETAIAGPLLNLQYSYHLSLEESVQGTNAIGNPSAFQNTITEFQEIFIRVTDPSTNCSAQESVLLYANQLLYESNISDFGVCDDPSEDGFEFFDFSGIETYFANGALDLTMSFYETASDRDAGINAIDETIDYQNLSNPQTIYLQVNDMSCSVQTEFNLFVNGNFELEPVAAVEVCDTNDDGFTNIDLNGFNSYVANDLDVQSVSYFLTEADALGNINRISNAYQNPVNPWTVYARVMNNTGCTAVNSLEIVVVPAPTVASPTDILICDTDQDAIALVDLTQKSAEITDISEPVNVSYFLSNSDAFLNNNPIAAPNAFETGTRRIYARVTNTITSCFQVVNFRVYVNTLPIFTEVSPYIECELNTDGFANFVLRYKSNEILNGQTGKQVLYYESENDAMLGNNVLNGFVPYQNNSNPQTIYARVQNITDANCFDVTSFEIVVRESAQFTPPSDIVVCDDAAVDGALETDLASIQTEIQASSTQSLNVSFYSTQNNANNSISPLPLAFTNTSNPQRIYLRVETDEGCVDVSESFEINILTPPLLGAPTNFTVCDTDGDGFSVFDLTQADIPLLDPRASGFIFEYYESQSDLESSSNLINTPESYTNSVPFQQTLFVKVINATTTCHSQVTLDLEVNLPPDFTMISEYEFCETDTQEIDLSEINTLFEVANDVVISYHRSQANAANELGGTTALYTYQNVLETVYVRFTNTDTGCFSISNFQLQINPNPVIAVPISIEACDDEKIGSAEFDLSSLENGILNGLSATEYSVAFFTTEAEAVQGVNMLNTTHRAADNDIIWTKVTNLSTQCYTIGAFPVIIHPLPSMDPTETLVVCDDDYDSNVIVDLTLTTISVTNLSTNDYRVSYFENLETLVANTSELLDPSAIVVTQALTTFYVRVENIVTGCFDYVTMEVQVNLPPVFTEVVSYEFCETENREVDLSEITPLFEINADAVLLEYYHSASTASLEINGTEDSYIYNAINEPVFVRVTNRTTGCFYVTSFELIINPNPVITAPPSLEACDDDENGTALFDLTALNTPILNGQSLDDFEITFYNSEEEANIAENGLDTNYRAADQELIWFRVTNPITSCYTIGFTDVVIHPLPVTELLATTTLCLDGNPIPLTANFVHSDSYIWSTGETAQTIEINEAGDYNVLIISDKGCERFVEFSVTEAEISGIDVQHFKHPNSATLLISGNGVYEYQLDDESVQDSNIFREITADKHEIIIYETNGCNSVSQEFYILNYPQYFYPNGSGTSSQWKLEGLENIPESYVSAVKIFDRYGRLLATLSGNDESWNGTDPNGKQMPSTDYWFSADVEINGKHIVVKGNFSLLR